MHYYKRNLGDYSKKAGRLSILQHGVYNLLLDACYDRETFPTMDEAIEWTWASTTEEVEAVAFVLRKFFTLQEGRYVQKRIQEEIDAYHKLIENNKRIANARETKRSENNTKRERSVNEACKKQNEAPPNQEPITNNQEPITKRESVSVQASAPEPEPSVKAPDAPQPSGSLSGFEELEKQAVSLLQAFNNPNIGNFRAVQVNFTSCLKTARSTREDLPDPVALELWQASCAVACEGNKPLKYLCTVFANKLAEYEPAKAKQSGHKPSQLANAKPALPQPMDFDARYAEMMTFTHWRERGLADSPLVPVDSLERPDPSQPWRVKYNGKFIKFMDYEGVTGG